VPSGPASLDESVPGYRRYLIAAGTARFDRLEDHAQLPSVDLDLDLIREYFTRQLGYELVLAGLGDSPTSGGLRGGISEWVTSEDRLPSDLLIVYYSGHGAYGPDGRHYLLTSDSSERNLVGTAFATEDLVRMLGASQIQHALIIIDTCYAGAGVLDLVGMLRSISSSRAVRESAGSGLWFLAAARPKQEAQQHAFARCLVESLANPRLGMTNQRYLDPNSVVTAVNEALRESWPHQQARASMGDSSGISPLLPNPRYRPDVPRGLDMETQRNLIDREDLLSHWGPRSRGVEVNGDKGWYFTGRRQALRELVGWLSDAGDGRMQVVTGGPGSGKSALLARLVTLCDSEYRSQLPSDQRGQLQDQETTPEPGSIDIALIARDKTLSDVVHALAQASGVSADGPATFIAALAASRPKRLTIVVDSLDEAATPKEIARHLLAALTSAQIPGVRVLVGTRRGLLASLGSRTRLIDLDDARYLAASDIAGYAAKILIGTAGGSGHSPYGGDHRLAHQVAGAVAARAHPTFLIARIVSRSLAEADQPVDIRRRGWRQSFPATVGDALEEYLERLGADQQRVRDLLQPLAYAGGAGLPWEDIWCPIASSLAGVRYTDSDIRWLLQNAGAYIVETTEHERSVYRLYHEALAEHLREVSRGVDAQRRIARTLVAAVPEGAKGGPDWPRAHPYIRSQLAAHAASAGCLDELLCDPLFLVAAAPQRLTEVIPPALDAQVAQGGQAGQAATAGRTYQRAAHRLASSAYAENAAALELTARCDGNDGLADDLARLELKQPWHTPWARWQPAQEYRLVGRHETAIAAMAVTDLDDRPIAVCGGEDGIVRCWDVIDGGPVNEPLTGHTGRVAAVATGVSGGQALIVSAGDDGTLRRWDLADGTPIGEPVPGHQGRINAHAGGSVGGRTIIVSGAADWSWRRWNAEDGQPLGEPMVDHDAAVTSVALCFIDGPGSGDPHAVVLSGSEDTLVRCWDLVEAKRIADPLMGHDGEVTSVACSAVQGRPVVLSAGADGTVRRWNIAAPVTRDVGQIPHRGGISAVVHGQAGGRSLLMSGGADRVLRRWDATVGRPVGAPIPAHQDWVNAMAARELSGRSVVASAGGDGTVQLWDLATGESLSKPAAKPGWVNDVDLGTIAGLPIAVAGGTDSLIHCGNVHTGEELGQPWSADERSVTAVAITRVHGRDVLVSCGADSAIRLWGLPDGRALAPQVIERGSNVWCVAAMPADGLVQEAPQAVTGDGNGFLRWWDLADARLLGKPVVAHGSAVLALTTGSIDGHGYVFSAGGDGRLCIWHSPGGLARTIAIGSGLLDVAFIPPRHIVVAGWRGMFLLTLSSI
jgi:WD40 repeat protein